MNAIVFSQGKGVWHVTTSPTMRSLGDLLTGPDQAVTIAPDDPDSALQGIDPGPYPTVEAAMAAIGVHLDGTCTHAPRRGYKHGVR